MSSRTTCAVLLCVAALVSIRPAQGRDGQDTVFAAAGGPTALDSLPAVVALAPAQGVKGDVTLAGRIRALPAEHKIYLVLRDLRASAAPGVLFHVYLDLPTGAKTAKDDAHYVGSFNMFNDVVAPGSAASDPKRVSFRSYDITTLARKLEAQHTLSDETTVTIAATHAAAEGSKPVAGRIELVEQ
jgi:hypothetical protein